MRGLVVFIMLLLSVISCKKESNSSSEQKLFIYNWTYYIPEKVLKDFEKEYNIKIIYDVFASNEEMFTKFKSGGIGYDIAFPSGDYVSIMIKENMLEKLDLSKIPNFKNINTKVIEKIKFDVGNQYSIPYMMGATGIAVNKKFVKDYKKDVTLFEREDLSGKMTLLDDMREVFGLALKYLGYSINTTKKEELEKAKELILKWKKNILRFDAESFAKGFAGEEFYVVHGYAENIYKELDEKQRGNVDFFLPEIGGAAYVDSMVILKNAKNAENAYKFINYLHKPEVHAQIADYLELPAINVEAEQFTKIKPKYTINDLKNFELKEDLGDFIQVYDKIWQDIRINN